MKMFANHIDLTVDHCADTRFALARESRRTERSENEAGNVERSLKPKLSEQTVQHERLWPHPRLPVLIFCRYEKEISPMASPPRRSRGTVTRDARGMIPAEPPLVKQELSLVWQPLSLRPHLRIVSIRRDP